MSATADRLRPGDDLALYGRLHREGRAEVIRMIQRRFPRSSESEVEDIVSAALLDMIRGRRLTHWSSGAIGLWYEMSRRRMLNHLRRASLVGSVDMAVEEHPSGEPSAQEQLEALMGDWRVVEAFAALSERAAAYVRLRVLAGEDKPQVLRRMDWSDRQYRYAQEEAREALRLALGGEDSPARCQRYREMIEADALGELAVRKRIALRAHRERCVHCRAYRAEAQRTVQALAPLVGLGAAPAGAGSAIIASGLGASMASKGAAALCIGALCLGGAYVIVKPQATAPPRAPAARHARSVPVAMSSEGKHESGHRSTISTGAGHADAFGLGGADSTERAAHPKAGVPASSAEAAFGLGASTSQPAPHPPPARQGQQAPETVGRRSQAVNGPRSRSTPSCVPGDLGC